MVNLQQIEACYASEKYKYDKPVEYLGQQLRSQKVTNPHTGTFLPAIRSAYRMEKEQSR